MWIKQSLSTCLPVVSCMSNTFFLESQSSSLLARFIIHFYQSFANAIDGIGASIRIFMNIHDSLYCSADKCIATVRSLLKVELVPVCSEITFTTIKGTVFKNVDTTV